MNDMQNEDPAPNYDEDEKWLDDNVRAAIENVQEILFEAGVGVNGIELIVPSLPGANEQFDTDYGHVYVSAREIE